jgi:hypothetical protein
MANRASVVALARKELGSTDWQPYWAEVCHPNPPKQWHHNWCGAFAMAILKRAGVLNVDACWIAGRGFVYPQGLPSTATPQPGDVAYVDQPFQHHMLVTDYDPATNMITTIGGNEMNPAGGPTMVRERGPRRADGMLFYSISKLVGPDTVIPLVLMALAGMVMWKTLA